MGKHTSDLNLQSNRGKSGKLLIIIIILAILILAGGLAYIYKITPKDSHTSLSSAIRFITQPGKTVFTDKDKVNVLCLGLDYNYTPQGILFTKYSRMDTIFVVNLDSKGKSINVLSIPRDTRVLMADDGYDKINAAYAFGEVKLAKQTVEEFLRVSIDYYIILKIYGVEKLVDALGGVPVDVEKDMNYDDKWGHFNVHLKKGYQILNGKQAVGYCRFRYDEEGDRGRIRRQHQFLEALIVELKNPRHLTQLDNIAKVSKECLDTNFSVLQIIDLARLYRNFDKRNLFQATLEGKDEDMGGLSYIITDEDLKERLVGRMFLGTYSYLPEEIKIEVLNGTDEAGLGSVLADKLKTEGFKIIKVGPADKTDYLATRIISRTDNFEAASLIAKIIGRAEIFEDKANDKTPVDADFTIIIGKDLKDQL